MPHIGDIGGHLFSKVELKDEEKHPIYMGPS